MRHLIALLLDIRYAVLVRLVPGRAEDLRHRQWRREAFAEAGWNPPIAEPEPEPEPEDEEALRFREEMADLDAQIAAEAARVAACDHDWVAAHNALLDGHEVCLRCDTETVNVAIEDDLDYRDAEEEHRLAGLEWAAQDRRGETLRRTAAPSVPRASGSGSGAMPIVSPDDEIPF